MTTTTSSTPLLYSVLTTSHDNNEDFVNQLRTQLNQIETNVQQTLSQIQQRKPYASLKTTTNNIDSTIRNNFLNVLRDVATRNNLPFDEPLYRRQILEKENSSKVDTVQTKPSLTTDTNEQNLSPVNNARRSQFAPVLSSTPLHQTSQIAQIPIEITVATPPVATTLAMTTDNLPPVLPSAIVPQRAKVGRNGGRPPRMPRGESITRQKTTKSIIKEQNEEIILAKEIYITSKYEINEKQEIIEDNIEVVIEQKHEVLPNVIKQVQTTPLRGKAKKVMQDNVNIQPLVEPVVAPSESEIEIIPKKTRGGKNKKKEDTKETEFKSTRAPSVRNRNKKENTTVQNEEVPIPQEVIPEPPKRGARNKKEIIAPKEENTMPSKRTTRAKGEKIISKEETIESSKRTKRNKKEETIPKDEIPQPSKRPTRNKKLIEPTFNIEEKPSIVNVRATPSRSKQKPSSDIPEIIMLATPKKSITKTNKRKGTEDTNDNPTDSIQPSSPKRRATRNTKSKNSSIVENVVIPPPVEPVVQKEIKTTRSSRRGKNDIEIPIEKEKEVISTKVTRITRGKKVNELIHVNNPTTAVDVEITAVTNVSAQAPSSVKPIVSKPPRPPVARKKKSIAMPPISQTSPSTPPPITTQRIQATSPVNDKPLLPLPIPTKGGRRRQQQQQQQQEMISTPPRVEKPQLETSPSNTRNPKRTRSSVASTPKRVRRDDLTITTVPNTPGKKRNACTCQKRRHRKCDICATAMDP